MGTTQTSRIRSAARSRMVRCSDGCNHLLAPTFSGSRAGGDAASRRAASPSLPSLQSAADRDRPCDDRHRHAVRAEYDLRRRIQETGPAPRPLSRPASPGRADGDRSLDRLHRDVITKQAPPFVEAAPGGRARILGIKRQEDNLIAVRRRNCSTASAVNGCQ